MKIHGNIEGHQEHPVFPLYRHISMNENSWQHWRPSKIVPLEHWSKISMNENSWQHWRSSSKSLFSSPGIISMNENSWQHWRSLTPSPVDYSSVDFHEWKFMATLKEVEGMRPCYGISAFPWMKIHGNTEGRMILLYYGCPQGYFHEWKFMATLKAWIPGIGREKISNFHEWKFMATLKVYCGIDIILHVILFPWMKIHGNIEGFKDPGCDIFTFLYFHEWKFMATLKAEVIEYGFPVSFLFPWMKIHGNIEGMHWRNRLFSWWLHFHEWKFMATLKAWSNHRTFSCLLGISMNENSCQHWRSTFILLSVRFTV